MQLGYMVATPDIRGARILALSGPLDRSLRRVAAAGFTAVELTVKDPTGLDAREIAGLLRKYGLAMPAVCTGEVYGEAGLSFSDPDPEVRRTAVARMQAILRLAVEFDAPVNVGRLRGNYVDGVPREQTLDWIRAALRACVRAVPGAKIAFEVINHEVSNCLFTTADGVAFVRDLGEPAVGLELDLAHMMVEGEDVATSLALASPYLLHVHVADSDRLPPGLGTWDLRPFRDALVACGYTGCVAVEAWPDPDEETAVAAAARTLLPLFRG